MRLLIALALLAGCEPRDPPPKPVPVARTHDAAVPKLDLAPEAPANLPPACAAYRVLIARLAQCDQMDNSVRDSLRQAFTAMEDVFAQMGSLPADTVQNMNTSCQQGVDALKQVAEGMCPDVMKVERE